MKFMKRLLDGMFLKTDPDLYAKLDEISNARFIRKHEPECKKVYDPFAQCEPGCETDVQLRARVKKSVGARP